MGTSFSALEMPITAPGAGAVLNALGRLDAKGQDVVGKLRATTQQAQASIRDDVRLSLQRVNLLAQATTHEVARGNASALQQFRSTAAAERAWAASVGASQSQLLRYDSAVQRVRGSAVALQNRYTSAFQAIALGFASLASATDQSFGAALQRVIAQGAAMAFMLGPQGAIVGAVAALDIAVWNHVTHIGQAFDEAMRQANASAAALAQGGDLMAVDRRMQALNAGDLTADDPTRVAGIERTEARLRGMQTALARDEAAWRAQVKARGATMAAAHSVDVGRVPVALQRERAAVEALTRALVPLQAEYQGLAITWRTLTAAEGRRARATYDAARAAALDAQAVRNQADAYQILQRSLAEHPLTPGYIGMPKAPPIPMPKAPPIALLPAPPPVSTLLTPYEKTIAALATKVETVVRDNFGHTLATAVQSTFANAFSTKGLGGIFDAFGHAILAGLGSLMVMEGQALLEYGAVMMKLTPLLTNIFTAGPAALAAGLALIALGSAFSGAARGGGGGGGGAGGSLGGTGGAYGRAVQYGSIDPRHPTQTPAGHIRPPTPVTVHATIIGKDDPSAQRQILALLARAQQRGRTAGI